jgi:hypothetical protein
VRKEEPAEGEVAASQSQRLQNPTETRIRSSHVRVLNVIDRTSRLAALFDRVSALHLWSIEEQDAVGIASSQYRWCHPSHAKLIHSLSALEYFKRTLVIAVHVLFCTRL